MLRGADEAIGRTALLNKILSAKDFILTSHQGPDADGLGAEYALCLGLRALGKRAIIRNSEAPPARFGFIDARKLSGIASDGFSPLKPETSILVVLDTSDTRFLGSISDILLNRIGGLLVVDHHEAHDEPEGCAFIDSTASSTCELVYWMLENLGARLPLDGYEALFAGIVYDTGSFAYSKTRASTFACAEALVARGVEPYKVHRLMYESSTEASLMLHKAIISTLELAMGGKVAALVMTCAMLEATGAEYEDAENLINIPLGSLAVEVSVMFKENRDGALRCSLRSKGLVNVARIAQAFGGGGHKTASGFKCRRPLAETRADVLERIGSALQG